MAALDHDEVSEMLAIYSLDALPADEAALVEQHLADCRRCQADLASLREVAGLLAGSATSPPEELWDRIAAELTEPASGPPLTPPVIAIGTSRKPRAWRVAAIGLVAALLAVLGVLSYRVVNLDNRVGGLQSALAQHGPSQQVALALADPAHQKVQLTAKGSTIARHRRRAPRRAGLLGRRRPVRPTTRAHVSALGAGFREGGVARSPGAVAAERPLQSGTEHDRVDGDG